MERKNDKTLTNAALVFVLAIVLVMLAQGWMAPNYTLTNKQVQQQMLDETMLVLPVELKQMHNDGILARYTLVDLGETPSLSIPGAINIVHIPFKNLLEKKNLKQLKKADNLLLFGFEESQAMMAGQLLASKGVSEVKVASNNIAFNTEWIAGSFDPRKAELNSEKARFDYNRFFKGASIGAKSAPAPSGIPQGVKVVKTAGGGC